MADERLGFELDIDVDAHRLPAAVRGLEEMDRGLNKAARGVEHLEKVWRDASGRMRHANGRFAGAGTYLDQLGNQVTVAAKKTEAGSRKINDSVGSIVRAASALSILRTGGGILGGIMDAADRGGDVAIKAMGERSASIRAYTQLLGGDKRGAALEFYRAQEFAQKTDFSSAQIEQSQARLMAQGFRGRDLYATLFSAADLAAIMPGDKNQTLERVTMAMSQIKGKGKLQGEELTGQLAEAGLNTTLVKQQLAKSLGIKVGDVDKRISSGGVSADVALPAIQRAILAQLGTSRAGEFATSGAGSLTALISNRDEAIQNVLKGFDADANLPAMDRYKKALQEQGKLFDINSKTGRDLSLVIQDLSNASLEAKSAWTEFSSGLVESFAENYSRNLRANGRDFNPEFTSQALRNLGEAIGRLGTLASMAVGGVNGASGGLAQRLANAFNKDVDMWTAVMDGRYGAAAKLAAGSLMDRVPGTRAAKELARSVYDWEAGGNLESREDKGFTPRMGRTGPTIPTDTASRKAEQKRLEAAAKSGKSDAYRGVFWDYQFDGSIGVWAKPPSVESLSAAQQVSVRGISQAIQAQAGQQQITIQILGYNKDKMELARALAEELGRVARSPR